jgi:amino acid adenylation domain-containing protein
MREMESRLAALPPEVRRLLELRLQREKREIASAPVRRGADRAPLSFAQRRLWFLDRLAPGALYNSPLTLRVHGALNAAALERALGEVVRRHEALRSVIRADGTGEPEQVVLPHEPFVLAADDLSAVPSDAREEEVRRRVHDEIRRPFDLARGPLFRARLLRLEPGEHVLVLAMHHVVSDGWSLGVLFRELGALYQAFSRGAPSPLGELPLQYADFAAWEREHLDDARLAAEVAWWQRALRDAPAVLELPSDRPRPPVQSHRGARLRVTLPHALAEEVRALARREGATPFMVMLAAFHVLLWRWSGQEDVVVGSPVAGRTRAETEGLIGFFVNTLALRADLSGDPPFRALLHRVREATLGAYQHQELPFERLVEALHPGRSLSHAPVFQTVFALQNSTPAELTLPGVRMEVMPTESGTARFDMEWLFWEREEGITGTIDYATDLFDGATVERMIGHYRRVLQAAAARPDTALSALPLLDAAERELVVHRWNDAAGAPPAEGCIHVLFECQARRTPDAAAILDGESTLTYAELEARANALARRLRGLGVGAEVRVGIHLPRGADLVAALLAVLKAGGAYLPLDPAYPAERLAFMLEDADAAVVLTTSALRDSLPPAAARIVALDAEEDANAEGIDLPAVDPASLAYLIYTSGSTGRPKGVQIEHRSAAVLLRWAEQAFAPEERAGVMACTSICFDISVFEIFFPLATGGAVVMARDALALPELPRRGAVTLLNTVPSAAAELVRAGLIPPSVRTVCLAGEPLPRALADALYATGTVRRVLNLYGPSEDTTYSTWSVVENGPAPVTIGGPVAGTRAYVLDAWMRPVPVGVPGELYLAGAGLARGYLGRPALTADRFVPDPLGAAGERLYRTGDRVRWTAAGVLDFMGRADHQVKVRGFRIEPGEVEAVLRRDASISDAVVTARGDGDARRLVAYVVPAAGTEVDAAALRAHLRGQLPEFMVPQTFSVLERLPLTPSGKVDRRALPEPEGEESARAYVAPRTETEAVLAGVWAQVLGRGRVGVHDDFFELGGHSLLAAQAMTRAAASLGVDLPLRALFEAPSVAALAARLDAAESDGARPLPPIVPVPANAEPPLSFAQERLWVAHRLEGGGAAYHMPAAWRLRGALDTAALRRALAEIVRRHEPLRTGFALRGTRPVQVVHPAGGFAVQVDDLAHLGDGAEAVARRIAREDAEQSFDLEHGPLVRARLLRLAADDHVLLLVLHHAAGDGWSFGVLAREIAALYAAFARGESSTLPPLPVRYADYAVWQRAWLADGEAEAQAAYWRGRLAGAPPALELPADRPRPAQRTAAGAHLPFTIPAETAARLRAFSRGEGATLFMALAAAFSAVLGRWSGQDDVVVGTPVANRRRPELEGLAGCFVNTLALRTDLSGDPSFRVLLGRVREATLGAFAHQDLPFDRVVDALRVERSAARHAVFQALLSLQNTPDGDLALDGLRTERFRALPPTSPFDLSVNVAADGEGGLRGLLEYAADLFHADTAERLVRHFTRMLAAAAADPDAPVSALELMDDEERRRVLREWSTAPARHPRGETIHALFARVASASPDAPAIVGDGAPVTYGELDARSERITRRLCAAGAAGRPVALAMERSAAAVAAMLGVLKAGGAYVPVDPANPAERLRYVIGDSGAAALIVADEVPEALRDFPGAVLSLASLHASDGAPDDVDAADPAPVDEDAPAYVIYTSGSTGQPKGVVVPHRAAIRLVCGGGWLDLGPADGVLHVTALTFDVAVNEVWGALLNGARLVAVPGRTPALREIGGAVRSHGATVFLPSVGLFNAMVDERPDDLRGLRYLEPGGEALSVPHVRRALERLPGVVVGNGYGPTENGILTTRRVVRLADLERPGIPIGEPVPGTRVYVLDARMHPVPVGVPGELCAAGDGLAVGYAGRPELTAERFVTVDLGDGRTERVYRTGDRARWLPEGTLEYLGRLDAQVKVRGYRVEPGEVEAALARHPRVSASAVIAREDRPGDVRLVAYVVGRDGAAPADAELRAFLAERLPEHLVPSAFVPLPALPYTAGGKVDRRALPAPAAPRRAEIAAGPDTGLERRIAAAWAELLGVERVGAEENFFELGGTSLLLIALHERLATMAPEAALDVVELFRHTTVRAQARRLGGQGAESVAEAAGATRAAASGAVAVVGMAGRFPGAPDVEAFWRNLRDGVDSISRFTRAELEAEGYTPRVLDDPRFVAARGSLEGTEWFDAAFFGYSPRDAEIMDPQQRIFLETAWEALEHAGYAPGGRVGVFAGQSASGYLHRLLADDAVMGAAGAFAVHMANDKDFLATRVSYKLGLQGPAITVQTACSTSLVAVHQACRSLLAGECDTALAGGATVSVPAKGGYLHDDGGITSPDGACRPFDAAAAGTVGGSGVGIVVLRRLEDALADGDTIHAVVLGSAINNDGALKVGFTAPSVDGQAAVIRGALAAAGVPAQTVTYVETHGTGTTLGDPVEIAALADAFGTERRGFCALGAVKAGIGHLDAAAGVAGLIKTVLALRHRELPPTPHFREPNPRIGIESTPFYVNAALQPWETGDGTPRRAGVSSFGMGGTNAHVVLQEAPEPSPAEPSRPHQLLVLSARTPAALEAATDRLAAHLAAHPEIDRADAAFTLREGRRALPHRRTLVVHAGEDAAALLSARAPGRMAGGVAADRVSVACLFPGLGDHYPGMGRGLYESEPVYRAEVDRCAEILRPHLGFDIRDVLYPPESPSVPSADGAAGRIDFRRMLGRGAADPAAERLNRTEVAQPAVFVTGWALARLWESWGVRPDAVAGHSLGEYVAATVAGVFALEDALELVALRAKWIQALPGGAMLAAALSADAVAPFLVPGASVATLNTPESCVVAGPDEAVEEVRAALQAAGHVARRLPTTHAFHTAMMEPVAARLAERAARMTLRPPAIPLLSNVTGTWMTDSDAADPGYWARHLCQPVRFGDALAELLREEGRVLVEAGPGQTLGAFVRQQPRDEGRPVPPVIPSLRHGYEDADDSAYLLGALGRLWTAGVQPDWTALRAGERRRRVPLPTYPWERTRHWIEPRRSTADHPAPAAAEKTAELADWFHVPSWRRTLAPPTPVPPEHPQSWLVLADEEGVGESVAARLWEMKQTASLVRAGDAFARTPEGWTVRPGQADDFRALLAALTAAGRAPDHVLHFWALPATPEDEADALERWSERGWHTLRALAAAFEAEDGERPVQVRVIASQTSGVESADTIVPEKALLLGALRVMGQEDPRLACRAADFAPAAPGTVAWERRTARILAEVLSPAAEPAVAWRGAHRYAQAWEPAPVRAEDAPERAVQKHGVYLVTGGLGRVGMLLAGWLARTARARLVLTARTPFPPRAEWDAWVAAHAAGDGTSRRIRALRQMEAAGAEVRIAAVDVADEAAMRALVEDVRVRWGRLDGVVHAAGQVSGPSLHRRLAALTREDAEAQFRAKVTGTRVLERVLPPETEFVVLTSSISAVLGGFGTGAYAAANGFQDAFAAARHDAGGTAWISTGWDGWPDVMDEEEAEVDTGVRMGTFMTAPEAVEAFRRALRCATVPHLLVAATPLPPRLERWVANGPVSPAMVTPAASGHAPEAPRSPRALLGIGEPYVAPRTETERALERLWGRLLGVDAIGVHDDFFRLGGHSLLGTRLIGQVRQELGVELPMEALFRAPTLARMAAEIDESSLREADPELLAALLADVGQLSPEQVQALLEAPEDDPVAAGEGL